MRKTFQEPESANATSFQRERETAPQPTILLLAHPRIAEESLASLLTEVGYHVQQTTSSVQALDLLNSDACVPQVVLMSIEMLDEADNQFCERLRSAAAIPTRIIVLADSSNVPDSITGNADAVIPWPWHEQDLLVHIQSQLRAQQQISELVEGRAILLGTSLLSMEHAQSLHGELEMQTALHHELLQRVHTHIGALRDYLELEVRRLPLGIARESMRGVLYRVRNLSALYDTMAILGMEDPIDFCKLATRIGQGVKAMYSPRSKLPLVVEGELLLPSTSASPLALIVNELVTNAYRHAFPGGRFGKITITCGQEDSTVWCNVEDNGVGMPSIPEKTSGKVSGTILVQRIVRSSLGGTCTWRSDNHGTAATVRFPLVAP